MRSLAALILALIALAAPFGAVQSAREPAPGRTPATAMELVVFEADGCYVCEFFRQRILPLYGASEHARRVPMRFVNVSRADETKLGLSSAITIAPTVVLLKDGQEIERITGYTGPESFMELVRQMMGQPD